LNTGEVAIVVKPTDGEPLRPTVRIISNAEGDIVDEPFDVSLAERDDLVVESTLDPSAMNVQVDDYV
jgi:hypothetical protein